MFKKLTTVTRTRGCFKASRFESLEERLLLSASPPTVQSVSVASSDWSPAFYSYLESSNLGTNGYSIPVGSALQEAPLPWDNINQVRISFSEDVNIDSADLSVSGVANTVYKSSDFSYRPEDRTAVWTFATALGKDRYLLDLDANGLDPVTNLENAILDGDWSNSVTVGASGDGTAGGDFEFAFRVLPGDALGINLLEYNNLMTVYARDGLGITDSNYHALSDVNGDGQIESADWQVVLDDMFASTPVGTPAGAADDAPTTSGFDSVEIASDAVDAVISLTDIFDDAETTDAALGFAITSVSNSSLFEGVSVNAQTGELTIDPMPGSSGRGVISVEAVDSAGLSASATLIVDVERQNIAPMVTATATDAGLGLWTIEGWVTDPDDDLDPLVITLLGSTFAARVSVADDGYFIYTALLDPGAIDYVSISTFDSVEEYSATVFVEIG